MCVCVYVRKILYGKYYVFIYLLIKDKYKVLKYNDINHFFNIYGKMDFNL